MVGTVKKSESINRMQIKSKASVFISTGKIILLKLCSYTEKNINLIFL